ncbi:MAG: YeeE/YedE family protein [Desulfobacterales bacterium]
MSGRGNAWKWIFWLCLVVLTGLTAAAKISGYWALTALPVGFLFGFFLEKGDLCGSSAFSEVILMNSWKKIQGIWMVIVVSMLGFAILSGLGLVNLNPKPLVWASYIVGGIIFGAGMVFAGGCVSGSLYKTGQGNINSMAALIGIPIGIMMVEYGPLNLFHKHLRSYIIPNADGGPVTFTSVFPLPYGVLAVLFASATVLAFFYRKKGKNKNHKTPDPDTPRLKSILTRKWPPWQAGIAIGILACFAYLSSASTGRNYPLGVTHGVMHANLLLTETNLAYVHGPKPKAPPAFKTGGPQDQTVPGKKVSVWLMLEIFAMVLGAFVSASLSGRSRLLPKPPGQTITALFGGSLVGIGAAIAGGCVVGNIMSGAALMSVGNILFAAVVILTNWIVTHFYLMGGSVKDLVWAGSYFKR